MVSIRGLGLAALFVLGTAAAIGTLRLTRAYAVAGDSMRPTLHDGDYVQGVRLPPGWRPGPGAIVVARRPDYPAIGVIKRVAGRDADGRLRLAGGQPRRQHRQPALWARGAVGRGSADLAALLAAAPHALAGRALPPARRPRLAGARLLTEPVVVGELPMARGRHASRLESETSARPCRRT